MKKIAKSRIATFKKHTLRVVIGGRGGGIEINLTPYGYRFGKMSAYQNYLGGGILGSIQSDCNIKDWETNEKLVKISEDLKQYFAMLQCEYNDCEFTMDDYNKLQTRSASAY